MTLFFIAIFIFSISLIFLIIILFVKVENLTIKVENLTIKEDKDYQHLLSNLKYNSSLIQNIFNNEK
jgi:hypothetical protein